eukprot:TRINITY_DN212_c0_g1_i3.p1 TRINITY_DN212_c0_g1~~TRINITY_DN212_c0_g1_i3.p1  ORF type:complete len:266 (-),score=47.49 TRINITY_DN212_c0_g1_i3:12-809(-)
MLVVYVRVNVCQAMGANLINTIVEHLAPEIQSLIQDGRYLLRILSNYATERRATSSFRIPVADLTYKGVPGKELATRIVEAYIFACQDIYRAVTHNKGIMNGIDAVALALGQDVRAIESACHAWASRSGKYQPLTQYRILLKDGVEYLEGFIEIPLQVGIVGGSIRTHPKMKYTFEILDYPSTTELNCILASVGLSQNFGALRALVSEGIQKGHMGLHAKNVALQAGVPEDLINDVVVLMKENGDITSQGALNALDHLKDMKPML